MTKVWQLQFTSDIGETITLTVPRGDFTLNETQTKAAMAAIIAAGIVITAQGEPVSSKSATQVTTERETVNL